MTRLTRNAFRIAIAAMFLTNAACSSTGNNTVREEGTTSTSGGATLSVPVSVAKLPDGLSPPQAIAGDPSGGAYVLAASSDNESVFHWTSVDQKLTPTVLSTDTSVRAPSAPPSLGVAPDGYVWVAAGLQLIALDPKTGVVSPVSLPSVVAEQAVTASLPESLRGRHDARAVAIARDGKVAIARMASTTLTTYDPASKSFGEVPLPPSTEAWSVAYFGDGALAVGLRSLVTMSWASVLVVSDNGLTKKLVNVPDAESVASLPNGEVVTGAIVPSILASDGTSSSASGQTDKGDLSFGAAIGVGPDGTLTGASDTGLTRFNPSSNYVERIALPGSRCLQGSSGGAAHPTTSPAEVGSATVAKVCPARPVLLAVDGKGSIWFITNLDHFHLQVVEAHP